MSVLVTGGAGYIGSHVVLALSDLGEQVFVLDDLSTGDRDAVHPPARLIVGDIADASLVKQIIVEFGVEEIIHFAAKLIVPDSLVDPLGYYLANTVKSRALFAAAVAGHVKRFVFSSTCAVYGTPAEIPVGEDAPTVPISPYGTSKLMTEWMLRDAAVAHDLNYVTLRYFNVAGADPAGRSGLSSPTSTHLIKVASEAALGKRPFIQVYGNDYATPDGTCIRDYIHVTDLAAAHVDALRYLRGGGGNVTLNCGYGRGYSVLEVIDAVKRVSGVDFPIRVGPRRAGDPPAIVARTARMHRELGWLPQYDDLSTIITHAIAWERTLPSSSQSIPSR
jgi:UDP-glucose 4-epimerase